MTARTAAERPVPSSAAGCVRSVVLAAALAGAATALLPAPAQAQAPTFWDLIRPERIAARVVQFGLVALRTQVDLVYDGIFVSPLTGAVTLTGVKAWPEPDWDIETGCEVSFDRFVLRGAPLDEIDLMRFNLQTSGGTATLDCLPPEARAAAPMIGITELKLSRLTLDIDYRLSSSAATVRLYAMADGLAAVNLDADMDYVWFTTAYDMADPEPQVFLTSARLSVENLGGWERIQGLLPPQATDPTLAPLAINRFLAEGLPPSFGTVPSQERKALAVSAGAAWAAFLANPDRLVLETGFDPSEPKLLYLRAWEGGPDVVLDDLQPRLALMPSSARAILPADLVSKALDMPEQLTEAERLTIGTALATGIGAPRDIALADELLGPAIEAGSGEAALVLARALETREPEAAYGLALGAAASRTPGAGGLLDRVEAALPLARVLEIQAAAAEGAGFPQEAPERLSDVREEASMRLTGNGRTRSYATAALWALIGSAAGDGESAGILGEIDERMRLADPEARELWRSQEAAAVEQARSTWISLDLPSSLGGVN